MPHRHYDRGRGEPELIDLRWLLILAAAFAFVLCVTEPTKASWWSSVGSRTTPDLAWASDAWVNFFCCCSGLTVLASLWSFRFGKYIETGRFIPARTFTTMFPNTRALIVDHRLPNRQQLRERLEAFEVQVEQEGNGSRGVDRALNERFDIIFLAPDLPIMDAMSVQDILRCSGVRSPMVRLCRSRRVVESMSESSSASERRFAIVEPVEQGALETLLSRVLPDQKADSLVPVMDESLRAIKRAVTEQDYDQIVSLAQRLRELCRHLPGTELTASIDRLEACLVETSEHSQLRQMQATVKELSTLVKNSAEAKALEAKALEARASDRQGV